LGRALVVWTCILVWIFLLVLLTGCAATPGEAYTLDIDPAFTQPQQAAVLAAVQDWEDNVPVHIKIDVKGCSGSHSHYICMHPGDPVQHGADGPASGWCTANYNTDGGEIWLLPTGPLQQSATHELGHAMGLKHQGPGTDEACATPIVMAPNPDTAAISVQIGDIAQWYTVRHMVVPP
jgi:hypothetical protein